MQIGSGCVRLQLRKGPISFTNLHRTYAMSIIQSDSAHAVAMLALQILHSIDSAYPNRGAVSSPQSRLTYRMTG